MSDRPAELRQHVIDGRVADLPGVDVDHDRRATEIPHVIRAAILVQNEGGGLPEGGADTVKALFDTVRADYDHGPAGLPLGERDVAFLRNLVPLLTGNEYCGR